MEDASLEMMKKCIEKVQKLVGYQISTRKMYENPLIVDRFRWISFDMLLLLLPVDEGGEDVNISL